MEWRRVSGVESAKTIEQIRRFRENDEVMRREWQKLVASHLDQWAIVYGGGTIVMVSRFEDIRPSIPPEHMGSAVVRYVTPNDVALIL